MSDKCPFCNDIKINEEHGSVFAMKDNYPVTKGHHLIIPFRHTEDYFSMTKTERDDACTSSNDMGHIWLNLK